MIQSRKKKISKFKWRFCLWKAYFEQGFGLMNYLKYLILLFGLSSLDVSATLILGFIFGISCFFVGWAWYKWNWIRYEKEIQNHFDPFAGQVREKFGIPNNRNI